MQDLLSILHSFLDSVVLFVIIIQWNMPNCAVIIFWHAVIQINYEHMQKQEDQWNITNLCCSQCCQFSDFVTIDLVTSSPVLRLFFKSIATKATSWTNLYIPRLSHDVITAIYINRSVNSPLWRHIATFSDSFSYFQLKALGNTGQCFFFLSFVF